MLQHVLHVQCLLQCINTQPCVRPGCAHTHSCYRCCARASVCLFTQRFCRIRCRRRRRHWAGCSVLWRMLGVAVRRWYYSMCNACNRLMLCVICELATAGISRAALAHRSINYTCAGFIMFDNWKSDGMGCVCECVRCVWKYQPEGYWFYGGCASVR